MRSLVPKFLGNFELTACLFNWVAVLMVRFSVSELICQIFWSNSESTPFGFSACIALAKASMNFLIELRYSQSGCWGLLHKSIILSGFFWTSCCASSNCRKILQGNIVIQNITKYYWVICATNRGYFRSIFIFFECLTFISQLKFSSSVFCTICNHGSVKY